MTETLWAQKYRPKTIDECVLPDQLKETFNAIVKSGEIHNMLFAGTAGLGKTTVAKALCNQLNLDYILINGSEESGIDVLRNKIKQFASSVSLGGGLKVVILDEADYLNCLDENESVQLADGSSIMLKDMVDGSSYSVVSLNIETNTHYKTKDSLF